MLQFVNIREFKTKTQEVLGRLRRSDVILTIRGKPRILLRKLTEEDISLIKPFTRK